MISPCTGKWADYYCGAFSLYKESSPLNDWTEHLLSILFFMLFECMTNIFAFYIEEFLKIRYNYV